MPVMPALGRLKQEVRHEFKALLSYTVTLCLKKTGKKEITDKITVNYFRASKWTK